MQIQATLATGDLRIDALLGATRWAGTGSQAIELTFSFPNASSQWPTAAGEYGAGDAWGPLNDFTSLSESDKSAVRAALQTWSSVANVQFVETADNASGQGILRFAWTASSVNEQSAAYEPATSDKAGDVWLNALAPWDGFLPGSYGFSTLIHEIGHALGLKHPDEGAMVLPAAQDSYAFSLMSETAYAVETGSWVDFEPTTPMLYDFLAIQALYGINPTSSNGDDTYVFTENQPYFQTLWDSGGNDTIIWRSQAQGARIDLNAGQFSQLGESLTYWSEDFSRSWTDRDTVAIAFGVAIENAVGGNGSDWLIGNAFDNHLTTGLGNDSIIGGAGTDTVILPMFPNVFTLTESSPGHVTGSYAGYSLSLNDVELVQFGRPPSAGDPERFQTTIALSELVSGEAQLQLGRLTDLYLAFFGRAPDVGGLEYWQERLLEEGRDFATISKDFAWSTEAQALFPPAASNREFVRTVYLNCFGRQPDSGGWDYWTGRLDGLGVTDLSDRGAFVGELILGAYAPSSGEEDRSLLTNRHEAAMYYVNKLSTTPAEGYDTAINALLARVTAVAATEDKAEDVIDYAFANPVTLTGVMADQALLDSIWGT